MSIASILLPALIAPVSDALKAITSRIAGRSVADEIRLMEASAQKLAAFAQIDTPAGEVSRWVADLRASFRYLAAGLLLGGAAGIGAYVMVAVPDLRGDVVAAFLEMAGAAFSFIFGERLYLGLRGGKR